MLLHESKSTSIFAWPAVASAAVVLFLLRNRQITDGGSPGSGVTIAAGELIERASAMAHALFHVGESGLTLLVRVATAPAVLVYASLASEFRFAAGALAGVLAVVQHASLFLLHAL